MEKKAIVLGGTQDHITLIKKLQEDGYKTMLVDYNDDPPAKNFSDKHIQESTLNKEAVLNIAKTEDADLVIAACIDQALVTMAYVADQLGLPSHLSYQKALSLTNKAYMKNIFLENEIPTANFVIYEQSERDSICPIEFPLVVKPSDANSSKGVVKVDSIDKLQGAIDQAFLMSRSGNVIVEEYVSGEEYSADVIIVDGQAKVLMITQNIKSALNPENFTIVQNRFNLSKHEEYHLAIKDIAEKISQAFQLDNVPLLIQFIVNNGKVFVIEFSSRIGGGSKCHFIKKITGVDVLDYYISTIQGNRIAVNGNILYTYGAMNYLYARSGVFQDIDGMDQLIKESVITDCFYYKTTGMRIENNISSADRPAGYMIVDNDYSLFEEKNKIAKENIKILNEDGIDIQIV